MKRIHDETSSLGETVSAVAISPLIQAQMTDALDQWRKGLATTIDGLTQQNRFSTRWTPHAAHDRRARLLNEILARNAERIGGLVRNILILGAAVGLLLGGIAGLAVARSITRPFAGCSRA